MDLSRSTLKKGLAVLDRPGYGLAEGSLDPVQEQVLATFYSLSDQKDTYLDRQTELWPCPSRPSPHP